MFARGRVPARRGEVEVEESLGALDRARRFGTSKLSLQRLVFVQELVECAHDVGYDATVHYLLPLVQNMASDPEVLVRQSLMQHFGDLAGFLIQSDPEKGYEKVARTLLPTAKMLLSEQAVDVRQSAMDAFVTLASHLRPGDCGDQVLMPVISLSQSNDDEDARSMAVQLLGHLAEALGPDLCKQFVGVQLEAFCEDQSFRVRKAAAGGFAEVAKMLSFADVRRRLVPAFEKLTKDPHWGVKKAVAENLVTFAMTMPADQRRACFEPMVNNLLNDSSRFVSCAMLQQLGYFIGCLEDAASVPKTLLEQYLQVVRGSMANPDAADMSFHCAFTFAAVVRTMGSSEWPSLKAAFTALCADAQAKTRKAMAASCHIVAQALGPDLVEAEVLPSFEAFLQNTQLEVRMAAIKTVASLLQAAARPAVQRSLLQALMNGMRKVKNWRCRHLAAQQLGPICLVFSPRAGQNQGNQATTEEGPGSMAETKDITWRNLVPLFLQLCGDGVAQVRDAAAKSASALLSAAAPELFIDGEPSAAVEGSSGCSQQPSQSSNDFARRLIRQFARGKSFRNRMLYIRMCDSIIREAPLHVFTEFFMRPLLWLTLDPVKNVRLCWATVILPHLRKVGRLGQQRMVLAAAVRLRSTLDREVHRVLEEAKLPDVSEAEIAELPDPETDLDDSDGGDMTGQEGETGSSSECGNVQVREASDQNELLKAPEDDVESSSQETPPLPLPRPVPQALKTNSPLQGPSLPPALRNASPTTPPGHDAVEDGLVQQQEIEKELDETFSDRRLLVEAEAMDPTSLGIERREKVEEVESSVGGRGYLPEVPLLPEAAEESAPAAPPENETEK